MPANKPLTGTPAPVEIAPGGYTLTAPNVRGFIRELTPTESASRSDSGLHEGALLTALAGAEIFPVKWFELEVQEDGQAVAASTGRAGGNTTLTRLQEPAIVLRAPELQANTDSVVLYTDEGGVSRWIFPEARAPGATLTGSVRRQFVFHLPSGSAPSSPDVPSPTRGWISKLGRRMVRILAWATDDITGLGALVVARKWENAHRPYALRQIRAGAADSPVDFKAVQQGRALLFLHGTFSTAQAAFGEVPSDVWSELSRIYNGRLLALDHPTIHESPEANAQRLVEMLPPDTSLDLDVVTHSRGGLVCRELTERPSELRAEGRKLVVQNAVLVAAPNLGTMLADGDHGIALLDRYTNLFTELPDDVFTLSMEGLFAVAKLIAHGALAKLPGLACMYPPGPYLARINQGHSTTRYFAVASSFQPKVPGLAGLLGGFVAGKFQQDIFGEDNDVVVPTRGSYEWTPASSFSIPAERRLCFGKNEGVHHCNYFGKPALAEKLLAWLSEGLRLPGMR